VKDHILHITEMHSHGLWAGYVSALLESTHNFLR